MSERCTFLALLLPPVHLAAWLRFNRLLLLNWPTLAIDPLCVRLRPASPNPNTRVASNAARLALGTKVQFTAESASYARGDCSEAV